MNLESTLQALCAIPAVSGFEPGAADAIHALFAPYCDEFYSTPLGSHVGVRRCGKPNSPLLLIDGHLDQVGGHVTKIENGFVYYTGNLDRRVLPGAELIVHGRKPLRGIVCVLPTHQIDDPSKLPEQDAIAIDLGLTDDEAKSLVSPGDQVTYAPDFLKLANDYICTPSIDDRAAIAAGLYALALVRGEDIGIDVALCASAGEEVGGAGARTAAFSTMPDWAIALDVSFASQPGADDEDMLSDRCGATIARGPHMNRVLTQRLFDLADRDGIPYDIEVEAGSTGTNTSSIRIAGDGIACALIGLPMRGMHTSAETIHLSTIEAAGRLLAAFIRDAGGAQ